MIVAEWLAVHLVTPRWVVPVLGLGNTVGLAVSGVALLAAVRRARGAAAVRGMMRAVRPA